MIKKISLVHRFGQIIEKCLPREGVDPSLQRAGSQCRNGFPPSRERQRGRNVEQGQKTNKLVRYRWNGINRQGEKINGMIEAITIDEARAQLRKQDIITRRITKTRNPLFEHHRTSIKPANIAVFSRQMTTMLNAGLSLTQALDIIGKAQINHKMASITLSIKHDIENGLTLAESLRKHPTWFNNIFCNLIDLGERSGALDLMFDKAATYNEKAVTVRNNIKKALAYPAAVLIIAFLITAGLLGFVIPQFESLFTSLGAELPLLTRTVIRLSQFVQSYWLVILATIASALYGLNYSYKQSLGIAQTIEKLMLNLPIIGSMLQKIIITRFSRTLAITFAAGVPLVDALQLVANVSGSILYEKATHQISDDISNGHRMQLAMQYTTLFPNMVLKMIQIGEESGTLDNMLNKIADIYECDIDNTFDLLNDLLEPALMTILGLLVGGLVLAMYLPILNMGVVS